MSPEESTKKVLLVSDAKTRKYAEMFAELVKQGEQPVTVKILNHKEYLDAYPGIRPEQHIIFFGKNKLTQNRAAEITQYPVDCYGMKYGRQGNRAVLFAEKAFKKEELQAFGDYYSRYQEDYKERLEKIKKGPGMGVAVATATGIAAFGIAGIFLAPLSWGALAVSSVVSTYIALKEQGEITDVQYRCLLLAVYMDQWQAFLDV